MMVLFKIKLQGYLTCTKVYVRGYEDKEEEWENRIYLNYLLFGKIKIFRRLWFSEDVPSWAVIKRATLGYYEWNSSRPQLINAACDKKVIKTITL